MTELKLWVNDIRQPPFDKWLEEHGIVDLGYFFHLHSKNPVGIQNMRAIIQKNGWREIK